MSQADIPTFATPGPPTFCQRNLSYYVDHNSSSPHPPTSSIDFDRGSPSHSQLRASSQAQDPNRADIKTFQVERTVKEEEEMESFSLGSNDLWLTSESNPQEPQVGVRVFSR